MQKCSYCKRPARKLTREHIIPRSWGCTAAVNDPEGKINIIWVCEACNNAKSVFEAKCMGEVTLSAKVASFILRCTERDERQQQWQRNGQVLGPEHIAAIWPHTRPEGTYLRMAKRVAQAGRELKFH